MALKGMNNVLRNLNREIKKIENNSMKGLILVAVKIRRGMDKHDPKIPIDTGNLRASWFVDSKHTMWGPSVTMGFTAEYAFKVHEMVGAKFQRPGSGAKFFEASLKREAPYALKTIKGAAGIR